MADVLLIVVKVTLVFLLTTILLRFDRRASSKLRSTIASLTLLSGALIPLLTLTGTGWSVPLGVLSSTPESGEGRSPSGEPGVVPDGLTTSRAHQPLGSGASSVAGHRAGASLPLALSGIWVVGLVAGFARLLRAHSRVRSLVGASAPVDAAWRPLLDEGRSRMVLRRPVSLRYGPDGSVPTTTGILHPVVLVPREAASWPESRRRAVLLHELAHVARRDVPVQLAERLCCLLYWFHPWTWKLARVADLERERACDDRVLAAGIRASDYAEDLLHVASSGRHRPFALALASPADLGVRIEAILSPRRRAGGLAVLAAAIVPFPFVALATLAHDRAPIDPLPPFSRVTSELPITVILESGETSGISMDGDPAEIARIRPEVIDGELVLRHDPGDPRAFSWREDARRDGQQKEHFDVVAHVSAPELEAITNRAGRGRIETAAPVVGRGVELETDAGFLDLALEVAEVRVRTRGSGVITLRGAGETGALDLRGGIVDARSLSLDRVGVRATGGVCSLGPSESLDVVARESAVVSYRGSPAVTADVSRDATLEREP